MRRLIKGGFGIKSSSLPWCGRSYELLVEQLALFCLFMASVVEPKLDDLQHSTDLGKAIRKLLQRLDLATMKPEFFFLGLVTVHDSLFTSWSMQVPLGLSFL